jgi:hypothetical protein
MRFKVFIAVAVALFVAAPLTRGPAHPYRAAGNTASVLHALDGFDWH